jgi:membrane-bound lytic murein transglycosylase D
VCRAAGYDRARLFHRVHRIRREKNHSCCEALIAVKPDILVTVPETAAGAVSYGVRQLRFSAAFRIGRTPDCEVQIQDDHVSRVHAQVTYEDGHWIVKDLNSSNGIFVDGERVPQTLVSEERAVRLGVRGPEVLFRIPPEPAIPPGNQRPVAAVVPIPELPGPVNTPPVTAPPIITSKDAGRYFRKAAEGETFGEHTMIVRRAFSEVQSRQKRKYLVVVVVFAVAALAGGAFAFYEHQETKKQKALAESIFYGMKSLDVDMAQIEILVSASGNRNALEQIQGIHSRRAEMEKSYNQFLATLHTYDTKLTEEQRLTLRIARVFGECELDMPPEFQTEIASYIKKWQSSGRLARAVQTAQANGYTEFIKQQLLAAGLPSQFFYMALQESDFDPLISGPATRKGFAKGMWQFIPQTAVKYGLRIGPLVDFARPDPGDDRHHWDRETKAAAAYLKDLYSSDAQASGLLVMACYNWGEDYVLPLVRKLPANPRERNFWRLLAADRDKIPQQTYDYVFYITSAAVIGENPRLFGFNFDNPLVATTR